MSVACLVLFLDPISTYRPIRHRAWEAECCPHSPSQELSHDDVHACCRCTMQTGHTGTHRRRIKLKAESAACPCHLFFTPGRTTFRLSRDVTEFDNIRNARYDRRKTRADNTMRRMGGHQAGRKAGRRAFVPRLVISSLLDGGRPRPTWRCVLVDPV